MRDQLIEKFWDVQKLTACPLWSIAWDCCCWGCNWRWSAGCICCCSWAWICECGFTVASTDPPAGTFTWAWSWPPGWAVSTNCACCESASGRPAIGRPPWGILPGSWGGGVCRLAAFCTGGPLDGSYCCWFCFCPAIWTAWGVGGIPPEYIVTTL